MKVTVFGGTGAVGRLTVARLLETGHAVTVHVRNPAKVPSTWSDVRLVVGEVTDPAAVDAAVAGADAVVSTLGPSMDRKATGLPLVEGTRLVVEAMRRHGVRRYVGNGTPSVLDPREEPTPRTRLIAWTARTFLPRAWTEMVGMSEVVMESGLDWTIVRFTAPRDGPARGVRRVGFFGTDSIGFAVTRADIAAFTAAQVDSDAFVGAAPAISG